MLKITELPHKLNIHTKPRLKPAKRMAANSKSPQFPQLQAALVSKAVLPQDLYQ